MIRQPNISVVIPVFNEADYIEDCLLALSKQTLSIHEIIVVDNNSTDETIAKVHAMKLENVIVVEEKRQGMVVARKYGFDRATGDVIMTIDADTVVGKTWASGLIQKMKEKDYDAVSCHVDVYGVPLASVAAFLFNSLTFGMNRLLLGHGMLFGSTYAVQHKIWTEVREQLRERNDIWEDLDLSLAVGSQGGTIGVVKTRLASISVRSARVPLKKHHKRFYEWPRTYWPYDKFAAFATIPIIYLTLTLLVIGKCLDSLLRRLSSDS